MLTTVPVVLTGILRYQLVSYDFYSQDSNQENINRSPERPEKVIFHDKGILYIILLWVSIVLLIGFLS